MFPIQERLLTVNAWSRPGIKLKAIRGIIIHWTANESKYAHAEANRRFFENRKAGKTGFGSTQYIVDDKETLRCVPDDEMCYQVGATSYKPAAILKYGYYPNDSVIGIEMCVNSDADFKIVYEQTIKLAAYLMKKYKLGMNTLDRHFDIMGKNCPAYFTSNHYGKTNNNFAVKYGLGSSADKAWDEFKDAVEREMSGKPQAPKKETPVSKDIYVVKRGDNLSSIAQYHKVTLNDILKANPVIKNPNLIRVGQEIKIPTGSTPVSAPKPKPAPKPTPKGNQTTTSIVTYLNSIKVDSSMTNRKKLAAQHGIKGYSGTANQNLELLRKLRSGTSPKPAPKGDQKTTSIVDYLNSIKVDSSMGNRKRLAAQHGIKNYAGTESQNLELLRKLRG